MSFIIPSVFKNPLILTPDHIIQNPTDPVVFGTPLLFDPVTKLRVDGVDVMDGSLIDEAFHGWLIDEDSTDTTDLLLGNGGNDFLTATVETTPSMAAQETITLKADSETTAGVFLA